MLDIVWYTPASHLVKFRGVGRYYISILKEYCTWLLFFLEFCIDLSCSVCYSLTMIFIEVLNIKLCIIVNEFWPKKKKSCIVWGIKVCFSVFMMFCFVFLFKKKPLQGFSHICWSTDENWFGSYEWWYYCQPTWTKQISKNSEEEKNW